MYTERNKLIAKFDGKSFYDAPDKNWNGERRDFEVSQLKYHESWDWLMPVVEKIKSNTFYEPIAGDGVVYVMDLAIDEALATAKIGRVFDAVVEFIEWYNLKNK